MYVSLRNKDAFLKKQMYNTIILQKETPSNSLISNQ